MRVGCCPLPAPSHTPGFSSLSFCSSRFPGNSFSIMLDSVLYDCTPPTTVLYPSVCPWVTFAGDTLAM